MKNLIRNLVVMVVVAVCASARATVWTNINTQAQLNSALAAAADGDEVVINSGTNAWTGSSVTSKALWVHGATNGGTVVLDAITSRAGLFAFDATVDGKKYRMSHIEFRPDGTNTGQNIFGLVQCNGQSRAIRFDHLTFSRPYGHAIVPSQGTCGVADATTFRMRDNYHSLRVFHNAYGGPSYTWGDGSWALPMSWGTTNVWDLENCTLTNDLPAASFTDGFGGARILFRHNHGWNGSVQQHGTESSGRYRSTLQMEIYNNDLRTAGFVSAGFFRGGSQIMCSNALSGYQAVAALVDYGSDFPFWYGGGWNGTNAWCSNSPAIYASGTATGGGTMTLVDASAAWTPGQWTGYTLRNTSVAAYNTVATGPFSFITTNTATTITFAGVSFGTNMVFTAGQHYEIRQVLISLDQIGRGTGDAISGDPATPIAWPHQSLERSYFWANTNGGVSQNVGSSGYPHIVEGRDFTNGVARPGWVPLVYPHPLVTFWDGIAPTGGGEAPPPLPPPTPPVTNVVKASKSVKMKGHVKLKLNNLE